MTTLLNTGSITSLFLLKKSLWVMQQIVRFTFANAFALLPVLLAWLWALLYPQMTEQLDWRLLWPQAGSLLLQLLPLLLVQGLSPWLWHLLRQRQLNAVQSAVWVLLFWCAGMLLYPLWWLRQYQTGLTELHWLLAMGLSLLYWLHLIYQQKMPQFGRWRWLWSLDFVLLLLVLCWALGWALLLVSHPPGLAQQPIPVRLDWARIAQHPLLTLHYAWQFFVLAALMYGCYWFNRYWLVRRILAQQGLLPFVLLSLVLMLLSYAPLAWLLLQLPMNQVAVPAVPAGSQNPFDWYNFNFMLFQWLLTTPLILAFDRQQQETNLAHIQHQQMQTELRLLQQQINPHFLFNTLNNLYALCLVKSDEAPKLILQLADLLRYVVYQGQQRLVTLQQELDYLQHYLALQQLRVSNKTSLKLQFPDNTADYRLPPLLLIMLVENAYKHGVETSNVPGLVEIKVNISQHRLLFICRNTCPLPRRTAGKGAAAEPTTGLGLENLRRRLQLYYGDNFYLNSAAQHNSTEHHSTKQLSWLAELELPLEFSIGATDAEIAAG